MIAERKKWAQEAFAYNMLVKSWPELTKQAAGRAAKPASPALGNMSSRGKYAALSDLLEKQELLEVEIPLAEIEAALGFPLPASAKLYPEWWSNQTPQRSQCRAWMSIGWNAYPKLKDSTVTFRNTGSISEPNRRAIGSQDIEDSGTRISTARRFGEGISSDLSRSRRLESRCCSGRSARHRYRRQARLRSAG